MTTSVRPWVALCGAAFAALLAAGCGDTPKTAIRLIMVMPAATSVDQLHVAATVEGVPLLSLDVPKQVDGALPETSDVVFWVADAVAGKSVDFTITGSYQSALVADATAGLQPKLHKTLRLTVQLEATALCPTGEINCAGACVDPTTDRAHCGRCDTACSPNQVCRNSECVNNPCSTGQHECSGTCYPDDDVLHCGPSCTVCPVPPAHGTASCVDDHCQIDCDGGFVKCPGACVDLNTDPYNCGTCGHVCGGTQTCRNSTCTASLCNPGSHDCPGLGCVSNTDPDHCGTSCTPCPTPTNGVATCDGTSCGVTCNNGFKPCGLECIPNASQCSNWRQASPASHPSARGYAAMAYDAQRHVVVLFGGWNGADLGDTWEFDGATWVQKTPAAAPTARDTAAMAYHAASQKVVLFGGYTTQAEGDTWLWDGTNWSQPPTTTATPAARFGAAMVYDQLTQNVVLFGGGNATPATFNDVWLWSGSGWSQCTTLCPGTPPAGRVGAGAVRDATALVVFGGGSAWEMTTVYGDMYRLVPITGWGSVTTTRPTARGLMGFAWDDHAGAAVLFGGLTGQNSVVGETWSWSGGAWTQLSPPTEPSARGAVAMAYDSQRHVTVMFGGTSADVLFPVYYDETWEFVQ